MSPLNSLVNYIIFLGVGLQGVLAVPAVTAELSGDNADSVVKREETRLEKRASDCSPSITKLPNTPWYVLMNDMVCGCNAGAAAPNVYNGYRYTRGIGYHKIHTQALNWNDARKMCLKEGGHLSVINSITEATILVDMYSKAGPMKGAVLVDQILLGMHDQFLEGEFTTVHDYLLQSSGYTVWAPGQPDNGNGRDGNWFLSASNVLQTTRKQEHKERRHIGEADTPYRRFISTALSVSCSSFSS